MQARVLTASLYGVAATPVAVEADVSGGLPHLSIVGLPDSAVREAAERVRAAVKRSGFPWPVGRITVNLAPADLRKSGAGLDLPIAVAVLAAAGGLPAAALEGTALLGELSLSGSLRAVRGALAVAHAIREAGAVRLVTAPGCGREAALVEGLRVVVAESLSGAVGLLRRGGGDAVRCDAAALLAGADDLSGHADLADVRGQVQARRALEVAAAGGHNLLLYGPPGSGKTLLARRLPGLLPAPDLAEALEITRIASCAGLGKAQGLVTGRPFRAPHHSLTPAALVGGGVPPRPGEITLAHGGVLFLDELPEFGRRLLDLMRQPLEEGAVTLARAGRAATFPARFLLAAAMNPCPCGWLGDPRRPCGCTPHSVARYRARLSGPLLDRIDLQVEVPRLEACDMGGGREPETTAVVRGRVVAARRRQAERLQGEPCRLNGGLAARALRRHCRPDPAAGKLLGQAMDRLGLTARAHDRVLKVARTLADLAGESAIGEPQVAEALAFRALDRGDRGPGAGGGLW